MAISHTRLDKFISLTCGISRRDVRLMLAKKRVKVDGEIALNTDLIIHRFSLVELDNKTLQKNTPYYYLLNKPIGVVCATKDDQHTTVIDLIEHPAKHEFHIVGRLDLNTSGLVLLTNDSRWSERLMSPKHKVAKKYQVTLATAVCNTSAQAYVDAFSKGMYFEYENITTLPAHIQFITANKADVTLFEGKYHQIKRMFGRFNNQVIALHRSDIGQLSLAENILEGQGRELTKSEVVDIF